MKTYAYILATVDKKDDETISFKGHQLEALDERSAYLLGQLWAEEAGHLPVRLGTHGNDYVVEVQSRPEPDADAVRVAALSAAIEGVERAIEVGYSINKTADVAGFVVRSLREKGFLK